MNNAQIQLETMAVNGLLRVDVKIANAPADFFGAAFDLVIDGGDWTLKKYEAGEFFGSLMNPPLMLAAEREDGGHRIVAGVSLKRGTKIEAQDGTLVRFFLEVPGITQNSVSAVQSGAGIAAAANLKISFANNVLSTLKNGERVDIKGVEWKGITLKESAAEGITSADNSELQANSLAGRDDIWLFPGSSGVVWWDESIFKVYLVLGIALVVILLVLTGLFLAKKVKLG